MDLQQAYELDDEERKKYTFQSPYPQRYYSLPENIIHYFAKNPINVIAFKKLLQTCKYFFGQSKILPVKAIDQHSEDLTDMWLLIDTEVITVDINLKKLKHKLWIYKFLSISYSFSVNLASALTKHIYQCRLHKLFLRFQNISVYELKILVSGGQLKHVIFVGNIVSNGDGKITEFEKVFELIKCPILKIVFADEGHGVGEGTATKIAQIMDNEVHPLDVHFGQIPETFDFPSFAKFLKTNMVQKKKHNFQLDYGNDIIPNSLKKQLQAFVDEIDPFSHICTESFPFIYFPDINRDVYRKDEPEYTEEWFV